MMLKQNSTTFKTTNCFQVKIFWMHYQNQLVVFIDLMLIYKSGKNLFTESFAYPVAKYRAIYCASQDLRHACTYVCWK